jgi:hypothetical protein
LRVIDSDAGAAYKDGETALDWNQTGPPGEQGPPGITNVVTRVRTATATPAGGAIEQRIVPCNAGEHVISGGVLLGAPGEPVSLNTAFHVLESGPAFITSTGAPLVPAEGQKPNAWYSAIHLQPTGLTETISFYAVCAS